LILKTLIRSSVSRRHILEYRVDENILASVPSSYSHKLTKILLWLKAAIFFELFSGLNEPVYIIKLQATVRVDNRMVQNKLSVVYKEDVTLFLQFFPTYTQNIFIWFAIIFLKQHSTPTWFGTYRFNVFKIIL
jgi:hypothetical protein